MKKYMVTVDYDESDYFLFDTIEELLKRFGCKSIQELLDRSNVYRKYKVYEISNIWSK